VTRLPRLARCGVRAASDSRRPETGGGRRRGLAVPWRADVSGRRRSLVVPWRADVSGRRRGLAVPWRADVSGRRRGLATSRRAALAAPAVAVFAVMGLAVAGCDGGAIGQNTPLSSGQNFVSGSYASTVFSIGSRPLAPKVSGTSLTGKPLSLASYRGDVIVLNFWGSWCAPCRNEAPALGALARQMAGRGVRFVGVDIRDEPDAALAFMQDFNIGYPSFNDPNDQIALEFQGAATPAAIPSTIVIDRTGRIAARIIGGITYNSLKALLTNVAAERS
jgi:thiol-disulfide isomerase/thioredoxin